MKKILLIPFTFLTTIILSETILAHCPLCTAGAAGAAMGAAYLGVNTVVIGLFIGAFAVSMGWWISRLIKKQYVPFQRTLLILASFLLTVIPILPIIEYITHIQISLFGGYGTLLNRIYLINLALFSSIFGGLIVAFSPSISQKLTQLRKGKLIPFQGVIITLSLLILVGGIIQLLM